MAVAQILMAAPFYQLYAQGINLEYSIPLARKYGVDEGLPSNEVYKSLEGENGYVWLCTDRGIVRFDGNDFTTYDQKDGLPNHVVLDGKRDHRGRVWFSTYSNDIFYFDQQVKNVPFVELTKEQGISDLFIRDFYLDKKDTLHVLSSKNWASTYYIKLFDNFSKIEVVSIDRSTPSFIYKHIEDSAVIGCVNYPYQKHTTHKKEPLGHGLIGLSHERNNSYIEHNGGISYTRSAHYVDGTDLVFNLGKDMFRTSLAIEEATVSHATLGTEHEVIQIQKSGNDFLLSTTGGIKLWDPLKEITASYLNSASVSCFRVDKDGNYWISTINQGQFFIAKSPFKVIVHDDRSPQTFESFLIHKNLVLLGRFDNKITVFDRFSKQLDSTISIGPQATRIYNMHWLKDDQFLINKSPNSAILDVSDYSVKEAHIGVRPNKVYQYNDDTLVSLTTINGKIALFTTDGGLVYKSLDRSKGIKDFEARSHDLMPLPEEGEVLIASVDGVHGFNVPKRSFFSPLHFSALKGIPVSDIEKRGEQMAFATLGEGVFVYNSDTHYTIAAANGLRHEIVNCVKWFSDSTLLIGTNQGLSVALIKSPLDINVMHYSRSNGLLSNMVKQIEIHKNGFAYILTDKGLVRFHRSKLKPLKNIPLVFEGIEVDGVTFTSDSIVIPADHDQIFAHFKSMNFTSSNNVEYNYKIEPISKNWIATKRPSLDLSGLRPGQYTIIFAAQDPINKDIISKSIPVRIYIQSPFYQSLYFIVGIILAMVLLGVVILKTAIARIRKKAETQTQLIELEQLALRSQMNPHFFYNTLNSIQSFIATNEKRKAYDYIAKFARLVRNFMDQTNIKSIKLQDEIESLSAYMELEQMRFSNAFEFSVEIDEEIRSEQQIIQIPATMLQPLVENAIAHGLRPLESRGRISLRFKEGFKGIKIEIEDNGIGREKSMELNKLKRKDHKSYGLGNVTRRIDLLNRKYDLTISICTEDKFDSDNTPLGTIVTLELPKYDYT